MSKYGHRPIDWFEAIVNKLGGEKAAERFLRNELVVSEPTRLWTEKDGVISFSVTTDGTTGQGWIDRLKAKGLSVGPYAKSVLLSPDFKPTNGITTQIDVLMGKLWESDNARTTKNVRKEADRRKLVKPNAEIGCLIRIMFTNAEIEAMGLWGIVTMHDPIEDSGGSSDLLAARRDGGDSLLACGDHPDGQWLGGSGFAFAAVPSQVS